MKPKDKIGLFLRSFFIQTGWNFRGMQNLGFSFCLIPFLKNAQGGAAEDKIWTRHFEAFNTQPYMAGFVLGYVARMEEAAVCNGGAQENCSLEISQMKSALGTSTAALGDGFFWTVFKPFCFFFSFFVWALLDARNGGLDFFEEVIFSQTSSAHLLSGASLANAVIAVCAGLVLFNAVSLFVRWMGIGKGYRCAKEGVCELNILNWKKWTETIKLLSVIIGLASLTFCVFEMYESFTNLSATVFVLVFLASFFGGRVRWFSGAGLYIIILLFYIAAGFITRG